MSVPADPKKSQRPVLLWIAGAVGVVVIVGLQLSRRATIESLVMPGPLTESHAKYEVECAKCHSAFKKGSQDPLCLECHKDVQADIQVRQGLHGRVDSGDRKPCQACHTDHKGRAFDIVRLDKETFRHELTDFPLIGSHARLSVTCQSCHADGKKFREASSDCFSCHAKDDRHKGRLGKNCRDCHNEADWQKTYFDHAKTRFPLNGAHQKVLCNACHVGETYKTGQIICVSCHLINDVHDSPQDERCDRCHNSDSWKKIAYDHTKDAKFALSGKHVETTCRACHPANVFKTKISSQCSDCHKADDVHKGKNTVNCGKCHTATAWKQNTFDHNRDSKYKLAGEHAKVSCESCHKASATDMKIDQACYSCHQADDVHKGQQGTNCQTCHNDQGWKEGATVDHDLTRFPLIGQHAVLTCSECHPSSAFKDAKMECVACHTKDDAHKKTLGTDCAKCHNPNGWKLWEFDHNVQTSYKLEGPHAGIKCSFCHKEPIVNAAPGVRDCIDCHEEDDVHEGQFGEDCAQCHAVDTFKNYTMGRGE